jgi:transcription termination/antitermination protein NusA
MSQINLTEFFSEFKSGKKYDQPTMIRVMEDMIRTLIKKKYGSDDNFQVIVNAKGDLEILQVRQIVQDGEVGDERTQIPFSEARKQDATYTIGEDCFEQITIESFGRRAIQAARQTLISRLSDLQKDDVLKRFQDRIGDLIIGEVSQILRRDLLVFDAESSYELLLPRNEMIKMDNFRKGDTVRAVIKSVDLRNSNPVVILSRNEDAFLERLLEQEVPEIEDGIIIIRKVVRLPGERAKVAVESTDDKIDPVGACVGMRGMRIQGIIKELHNENIDIIPYTTSQPLFIQRALTPAKFGEVRVSVKDGKNQADVYYKQDQIALAIGKAGSNIKLASRLTEFEIDVHRVNDEFEIDDVDLEEFSDVFEKWVIDDLKKIGCFTARDVLDRTKEELLRMTDLEDVTIDEVIRILAEEFEDSDGK